VLFDSQHFEGRGACCSFGMGLGWATSGSIIHMDLHKPNKLISAKLEVFWCTDEPWANMDSQDSPQPELGEATNFPLIVYYVHGHRTSTQISFCHLEVPKFPKLGLLPLWRLITLCVDLRLKQGLKQSCNPCRELFNSMWQVT
jgi:hypothetical protein